MLSFGAECRGAFIDAWCLYVSVCVCWEQYQQLVREQQEESRRMFEVEKDKAVAELRAMEQYEEFKKKVSHIITRPCPCLAVNVLYVYFTKELGCPINDGAGGSRGPQEVA